MSIERMPTEICQLIAEQADPGDILSLADASPLFRRRIENETEVASIESEIAGMNENTQLCNLLGRIELVSKRFHGLLLLSFGSTLLHLSIGKRQRFQVSWLPLAKAQAPSNSQLLWYLVHAVESKSDIAYAPELAARGGIDLLTIIREFKIEDRQQQRGLEIILTQSYADEAVRAGENVQEVAQRCGITSQRSIHRLERISIQSHAGGAVRAGENVQDVAQRCGITEGSMRFLERISIENDARQRRRLDMADAILRSMDTRN
ncbi:hypothetical protein GGI42DRAFT_337731 [Trichoderma sp. SZMC 28013]